MKKEYKSPELSVIKLALSDGLLASTIDRDNRFAGADDEIFAEYDLDTEAEA